MNILTMMETFATVVETNSFTAAADRLQLSKSFVSKQVSQLEAELGTRLIHRTTRKLNLTEEGAIFYKHCQSIMSEAENARAEILESQSCPRGKIKITLPQSMIIAGAGETLLKFQKQYQGIELDITVSGTYLDLIDNGIDLAIRIGQLEDSTLICRKLRTCFYHVVASPDYIKKYGEPQKPIDLKEHNCLVYSSFNEASLWSFRIENNEKTTLKAKGNLTTDDGLMIVNAVRDGMGIAFGPNFLFDKHIKTGELSLLLPKYSQPTGIFAIYPANRNLPRRVRMLIDFLKEDLSV